VKEFKFIDKKDLALIPQEPGVYALGNAYIGKAANLKSRIKNHFSQPSYKDKLFLEKVSKIGYIKTGSEIQALILESELIKKYQPRFNTLWKDDKNYFFVALRKTACPEVSLTHQKKESGFEYLGPFTDGRAIKETLKILRKVFPYYTHKKHPKKACSWCALGLCPGPVPNLKKCRQDKKNLKSVLKGKSGAVFKNLKKEMLKASAAEEFERAAQERNKMNFLAKVMENARIISDPSTWEKIQRQFEKILDISRVGRIEGYDISNIQGKNAVGSMVVFQNGRPEKSAYRKFKINLPPKPDDTGMIKEVISRRLKHPEWPLPDLILIDGGKGQLNAAQKTASRIPVISLAKRNNELFRENSKTPLLLKNLPPEFSNLILRVRDESHRFAVSYHRKLRQNEIP